MADKTVTVKPAGQGGTYTTLALAIAGELAIKADLTAADFYLGGPGILNIAISGNWSGTPDGTFLDTIGFTTSAAYYLNIYTDDANRYKGKWDTTKYIFSPTVGNNRQFYLRTDYAVITGLQFEDTYTGDPNILFAINGITATNNRIQIKYCGFKCVFDASHFHMCFVSYDVNAIVEIYNSVFWNLTSLASAYDLDLTTSSSKLENITVYGGYRGIMNRGNGTTRCINVIAANAVDVCFYDYTYMDGSGWCSSTDNSAVTRVGNNSVGNKTFSFVDATNGDFHLLVTDAGAKGLGTDGVTLGFTDDVDGVARGAAPWDIGADEYVAGVGADFTEHRHTLLKF